MVLRGQFLERPTLIPVGELVLEGLWHRGSRAPPLLVLPPPPQDGSGMDHVVCAELAWAATRANHAELRFNFRGIGASQGEPGGGTAQLKDAEAALALIEENARTPPAVAAVWGSSIVARALLELHPTVRGIVLIDPPQEEVSELIRVKAPLLVVVAEQSPLPRAALAAAVTEAGGQLEIIPDADRTYRKNLTQVGRAVADWLERLSPADE